MAFGKLSRRTFTKGAAALTALAATGGGISFSRPAGIPDMVVANGSDYVTSVKAAVDAVGGIARYVQAGQTVGILVNTIGRFPGTITNPEVIRAVVSLCRGAGAKEIVWFDWRDTSRLEANKLIEVTKDPDINYVKVDLKNESLWRTMDVPRGKALQKVRIFNILYEVDVFIALPIFKHHGASNYTGTLKLNMGVTHPEDNRAYFHRERGRYLEQCVADLNTVVRPPDLILMDAIKLVTTRGPIGPGNIVTPNKLVAGFDKVAMDTYCAPILNINPKTSVQISGAFEHGIGEMDLSKVTIQEIQVG